MLKRLFQIVSDTRQMISNFTLLLTSPTSIMAVIFLFIQFGCAAMLALSAPILIRSYALPSSIERSAPLNLVFEACQDQVHALCSFPTATLDLKEHPLFSPNVYYGLTVKLQFAEVETTKRLGLFQNVIRTYDSNGTKLREYSRTSYLKEPSMFKKAQWLFFLPLYLTGFFSDPARLDVTLTLEHFEIPTAPSDRLFFQLQNRFAEVESAELAVTAQFGLIRHLLYYYPITTFILLWLPVFSFLSSVIFINWGYRVSTTIKAIEPRRPAPTRIDRTRPFPLTSSTVIVEEIVEEEEEERADNELTPTSSRSSTSSFEEVQTTRVDKKVERKKNTVKSGDEFIPENVDELPECVPPLQLDTPQTTPGPDTTTPSSDYGIGFSVDGPRKRRKPVS